MSWLELWYVGCKIRDDFYNESSPRVLSDGIKDDGKKIRERIALRERS